MKILYVTTISNTVNAFLIPHIKMLINQGNQVDVAFNIVQEVNPELIALGCKVYNLEFQRSPLKINNYTAYKKLKNLILSENYDLVHTHTPVASACVRLACRKLNNIKVFYTAHGFHFFKGAPLLNWIIYYPVERWLARYTDVLITINKEDYTRAKKSFKAGRVEYVPGVGIDIEKFQKKDIDYEEKRKSIGATNSDFIVLSVGELNKNKNHKVIIKAIAELKNEKIKYVICGQGYLENKLKKLAQEYKVSKQIVFLGYRKDILELMKVADLFAFPSFREGLSVSLMEAMASGLPVVCSHIRGNSDLIESDTGGILVKANYVKGFAKAINKVISSNHLRNKFSSNNLKSINKYTIENVISRLNKIYSK